MSFSSLLIPILLKQIKLILDLVPTKDNDADGILLNALILVGILDDVLNILKDDMLVSLGWALLGPTVVVVVEVVERSKVRIGALKLAAWKIYYTALLSVHADSK